jgi:hypothetical protein
MIPPILTFAYFWESRQFYSAYIALFIAVSNWITIQYRLLLENIPIFNTLFSQLWVFLIVATVVFTIVSVLGGHYIHRKRQFRLEQAVAIEENPYLYRSAPGKERDLMIPMTILHLEAIQVILKSQCSSKLGGILIHIRLFARCYEGRI